MGRPPKGQKYVQLIRVHYRFASETVRALRKGARKSKSTQTQYVENAVLAQLSKDGIIE